MAYDLAIVGGGPAGLATAILAANRGLASIIFDKRTLPLDKACGEGIMPPGVRALREMGVRIDRSQRAPFVGIHYISGEREMMAQFPHNEGWGVRRTALIQGMVERAATLGVALNYGCAVDGWQGTGADTVEVSTQDGDVHARIVVAADGLNSKLRREAGLLVNHVRRGKEKRYGVRRHYNLRPWSKYVEVHWGDGLEAYVTPCGPEQVGVAILAQGRSQSFQDRLEQFPRLAKRLEGAGICSDDRAAGPFNQRAVRPFGDRLALIGDAAGFADAITGEGLTLSFRSAQALVHVVEQGKPLAAYGKAYRRISRSYYLLTGLLLRIAAHPKLRHWLVGRTRVPFRVALRLLGA